MNGQMVLKQRVCGNGFVLFCPSALLSCEDILVVLSGGHRNKAAS